MPPLTNSESGLQRFPYSQNLGYKLEEACRERRGYCLVEESKLPLTVTHNSVCPPPAVPLPECSMAPSSADGVITVSWDYVHTGGLNLTSVQVLYQLSTEEAYLGWLEGDVNCTSGCFLVVYNLTAGFSYVFVINASNDEGPGVEMCPEVSHTIGKL